MGVKVVLSVTQSLMTAVMERLPGAVPVYRRMAASTLHTIATHCRHPPTQAQWVISKLLGQLGLGYGIHLLQYQKVCNRLLVVIIVALAVAVGFWQLQQITIVYVQAVCTVCISVC